MLLLLLLLLLLFEAIDSVAAVFCGIMSDFVPGVDRSGSTPLY